jgi:HlyD family secretion protein
VKGGQPGGAQIRTAGAQCKAIATARKAGAAKVDDLGEDARPQADRQTLMTDLRAAYAELGVDMQVMRACRAKEGNGAAPAGAAPAGAAPTGAPRTAVGAPAATRTQTGANGARTAGASRTASRSGLVFIKTATGWAPRVVRLGTADYDYTEVLSGLEEGDEVALLSAAALQAQRQQNNDRMKAMTGGASPLGGATPGAGAGGGRPPGR